MTSGAPRRAAPRRRSPPWRAPGRRRRSRASTGAGSSAGQLPASTNSSTAVHHAARMDVGDALAQRLRPWPCRACAPSACTWRLMFDSATWSRSISVSAATPLRASASAAHEPTPPRPTTATRAARSARDSRHRRRAGAGRRSGARGRPRCRACRRACQARALHAATSASAAPARAGEDAGDRDEAAERQRRQARQALADRAAERGDAAHAHQQRADQVVGGVLGVAKALPAEAAARPAPPRRCRAPRRASLTMPIVSTLLVSLKKISQSIV